MKEDGKILTGELMGENLSSNNDLTRIRLLKLFCVLAFPFINAFHTEVQLTFFSVDSLA